MVHPEYTESVEISYVYVHLPFPLQYLQQDTPEAFAFITDNTAAVATSHRRSCPIGPWLHAPETKLSPRNMLPILVLHPEVHFIHSVYLPE